jgi:hypothetical protein
MTTETIAEEKDQEVAVVAGGVWSAAALHRAACNPVLAERGVAWFAAATAVVVGGAQPVGWRLTAAAGSGADTGHGPQTQFAGSVRRSGRSVGFT